MYSSYELRTCPRCGEERPGDDFRDWEGPAVCFDCGVGGESTALDELNDRIDYRRAGRCIARMADGELCGEPAEVADESGRRVCRAHAPGR